MVNPLFSLPFGSSIHNRSSYLYLFAYIFFCLFFVFRFGFPSSMFTWLAVWRLGRTRFTGCLSGRLSTYSVLLTVSAGSIEPTVGTFCFAYCFLVNVVFLLVLAGRRET